MPSPQFLRNMGTASIIAGVVLLALAPVMGLLRTRRPRRNRRG